MPADIVRRAASARLARIADEPDQTRRIMMGVGEESVRNLYHAAEWVCRRAEKSSFAGTPSPQIAVSTEDFALLRDYL